MVVLLEQHKSPNGGNMHDTHISIASESVTDCSIKNMQTLRTLNLLCCDACWNPRFQKRWEGLHDQSCWYSHRTAEKQGRQNQTDNETNQFNVLGGCSKTDAYECIWGNGKVYF